MSLMMEWGEERDGDSFQNGCIIKMILRDFEN